jgi:hypothetical protein
MDETQKQLLTLCSNSMVIYLTPGELEAYSEAERIQQECREAQVAMLEAARARNVFVPLSTEEEAVIKKMPPDLAEAARLMEPDELDHYADLHEREGKAITAQSEFFRIAAERGEHGN